MKLSFNALLLLGAFLLSSCGDGETNTPSQNPEPIQEVDVMKEFKKEFPFFKTLTEMDAAISHYLAEALLSSDEEATKFKTLESKFQGALAESRLTKIAQALPDKAKAAFQNFQLSVTDRVSSSFWKAIGNIQSLYKKGETLTEDELNEMNAIFSAKKEDRAQKLETLNTRIREREVNDSAEQAHKDEIAAKLKSAEYLVSSEELAAVINNKITDENEKQQNEIQAETYLKALKNRKVVLSIIEFKKINKTWIDFAKNFAENPPKKFVTLADGHKIFISAVTKSETEGDSADTFENKLLHGKLTPEYKKKNYKKDHTQKWDEIDPIKHDKELLKALRTAPEFKDLQSTKQKSIDTWYTKLSRVYKVLVTEAPEEPAVEE